MIGKLQLELARAMKTASSDNRIGRHALLGLREHPLRETSGGRLAEDEHELDGHPPVEEPSSGG
ncbi:hypothetical protein E4U39_006657 [Claviceps sp. Clav50 group G5]|nr:hypothetical protein E4U39_006657 [Claviceps sp. Clav50 group G5]